MESLAQRIFVSKLVAWIVAALVASFFLFSFNYNVIREEGWSMTSFVKAFRIPRLKLGIDLQGGTYLVLGVEVEKAVESRLALENKGLDQLFEKKGNVRFVSKEMKDLALHMTFADEEAAKIAFNLIKKEQPSLNPSRSGAMVTAPLQPVEEQRIRTGSVEQGVSVLSTRLNIFGVSGLVVQRHGERQIVVQLPGVPDPDRIRSIITKTAHLEFKIVEKAASNKDDLLDDFDYELPPDKMIVPGRDGDEDEAGMFYLVSVIPDLTGEHIVDARLTPDEFGALEVMFQLDRTGAREFKQLTGNNINRRLGIIIDNVMYSAPTIQSAIGAQGRITNAGSIQEAQDLALVLRSGSLLAPLKFEQETRVGASLGQDSIRQGLMSCLVVLLLLFVFSIFYYGIAGFFAMLALLYNLFLIILFLSYFEATLTLPGIAGMVLTVGMAIDASILIYERIRELLQQGETLRKAVKDGFSGAMTVILDSNITTFLTGLVLFKFGGPAIKGFAVTLMAGIIATLLSGVFFLKSLFEFSLDVFRGKFIRF